MREAFMEKRADWLRKAAAACEKVGILNKAGLLVNVGALSESNDPRRATFHSFSSEGMADIWYDAEKVDEFGHKIVPMTSELERRWTLLHKLRNTVWSSQPNSVLEEALRLATTNRPSETPDVVPSDCSEEEADAIRKIVKSYEDRVTESDNPRGRDGSRPTRKTSR